jgi:cytoplasmic iron level regulating protein YaaA (DUF328/UPF0246 family)
MLLLPPSEGKAVGGRAGTAWTPDSGTFGGRLHAERAAVAEALASAGGGDERLLGVRGDHLLRAQSANATLIGSPTLPAWRRYTGVVWDHLDPATLTADARRRIVVVSGLLGLVRADDPVPDYRLKMSVSLPPIGNLARWWRPTLAAALGRSTRGRVVVDLLPQEHRAAIDEEALAGAEGVTVSLVDPSGRPGGHMAKAAKGELARALLERGLDALDTWRHERFRVVTTPLSPSPR